MKLWEAYIHAMWAPKARARNLWAFLRYASSNFHPFWSHNLNTPYINDSNSQDWTSEKDPSSTWRATTYQLERCEAMHDPHPPHTRQSQPTPREDEQNVRSVPYHEETGAQWLQTRRARALINSLTLACAHLQNKNVSPIVAQMRWGSLARGSV